MDTCDASVRVSKAGEKPGSPFPIEAYTVFLASHPQILLMRSNC